MQTATNDAAQPGYRSGVAARLAGLSAATLRVWERRYQLTAAPRAANGQRLYTPPQVRRLGLLKQLVDQGHPIGTLAAMPLERLALMAAPMVQRGGVIDVAAIGAGLARRLAAAIDDGLPLRLHELDGASSSSPRQRRWCSWSNWPNPMRARRLAWPNCAGAAAPPPWWCCTAFVRARWCGPCAPTASWWRAFPERWASCRCCARRPCSARARWRRRWR